MPPVPSERRTVTILFSDLKGFTTLSEERDPEEVRELIDDLFTRLRAAIEAQGGVVDKFIGDAVMAVFGGAQAHEDDAFRAVQAGLAMQAEIAAFNREKTMSLELRIGINSGEVVYGAIAGEKATVIGDAVNVAQRLESACRPGGVLISSTVERATRGSVRTKALDPIALRGRQEHVQPYEAIGLLVTDRRYRRAGPEARPMIGRERELSRLRTVFETRKPAFVLIEGEAGIGKSRLIWEFHQYLKDIEETVSWKLGHCREMEPLPMDPWAEMLRKRARVGPDEPEDVATKKIVDAVLQDLAVSPSIEGTEDAQVVERENLAHLMVLSIGLDVHDARVKSIPPERLGMENRHSWERWLRALAERGPVVLVVEDLHWAHPAQIEFLEHLASKIEGWEAGKGRVLVLALTRPEGKSLKGFERMRLETLGSDDCGRMAEVALRMPATGPLLKFLMDESGGNPYYVEELSRYLGENNLVEARPSEDGGATVKAHLKPTSEVLRVPDTLNGLLVGRIDGLGREEKEAVKGASVVGSMFWLGVLEAALNRSADRDVKALEGREMVRRRVESELPGEVEYAFRHALLRDAAYSLLTKKDRMRLHGALGKVLEAKGTGRAKALAAAHWAEAGEADRAKRLYCEAAVEALERSTWEEGLEYARQGGSLHLRAKALAGLARYDEALEAVEEVRSVVGPILAGRQGESAPDYSSHLPATSPDLPVSEVLADALLVATDVYKKKGAFRQSLQAAEEVLRICERARTGDTIRDSLSRRTDSRWSGAMRAKGGALYLLGRYDEALATLYATIEGSSVRVVRGHADGAAADPATQEVAESRVQFQKGLAASLHNIGNVLFDRSEYSEAIGRHEESLAIQREIGDLQGMAASLTGIGNAMHEQGEFAEAMERHRDSLAIKREIGDRYGIAVSLHNIGSAHHAVGEIAKAMELYEESMVIRREIGDRHGLTADLNNLGIAHCDSGEYSESLRAHEESLEISREIGDRRATAFSLGNIGLVHHARGNFALALRRHRESLAIQREIGDRHGTATSLNNVGAVHLAQGNLAEAMKAQGESLAIAREVRARESEAQALMGLGEATAAAGSRTEGLDYLRQALKIFDDLGMKKEADEARAKIAELGRSSGRSTE